MWVGKRPRSSPIAQVVVIGGGLAGAATATHLARAGRSVVLLERDKTAAHKVCGEFLGRAACRELADLGVDLDALGAQRITQLRLFSGASVAQTALPFQAAGVSRRTLDPALRAVAARAGADIRMGARAKSVQSGSVALVGSGPIAAQAVVIATGKHEIRGLDRRGVPHQKDAKLGLKEHLRLTPKMRAQLGASVELHFFAGGYAGLMPIEGGAANLSMAIDPGVWRSSGLSPATYKDWLATHVPSLHDRLREAQPLFARPLSVSAVPYGFRLWRAPLDRDGLWRVGEQAIVTPSLTGEGMSLALGTARCLGACLVASASQDSYRAALRQRFGRQIAVARGFEALLERDGLRAPLVGLLGLVPAALQLAARLTRSS